jgi:curli biogenesis system outer membrane secretion channel CsgG
MNINIKTLLVSLLIGTISFSGCSAKKVTIRTLVPAEVPVLSAKRNIAVIKFTDDKIHLSSKIEAQLSKVIIDKKSFFTITNRAQLDKILKEQKLQSSDLTNSKSASKIGELIGAQAIIGGSVNSSFKDGKYREQRVKCVMIDKTGKCTNTIKYYVTCTTASATVSANINVIDVETAQTIHAQTITKSYNGDSCKVAGIFGLKGDGDIKSGSEALAGLSDNVAKAFVVKLAPRYIKYSVEIMDSVSSIDLTSKEKKLFENALIYLENGRTKKSEKLLDKLYTLTGENAFEVAYDLGVIKQSLGKYEEAKLLYTLADDHTIEPNKLIDKAILDIEDVILKQKEAHLQLKQNNK